MPIIFDSDFNPSTSPTAVDQLTKAFAVWGSQCHGSADSNDSEDVVTVLTSLTDLEEDELLGENDSVLNHLHNAGEELDLEITYPPSQNSDAFPALNSLDVASTDLETWGYDFLDTFQLVSMKILLGLFSF